MGMFFTTGLDREKLENLVVEEEGQKQVKYRGREPKSSGEKDVAR
jgi:hypothetical protein